MTTSGVSIAEAAAFEALVVTAYDHGFLQIRQQRVPGTEEVIETYLMVRVFGFWYRLFTLIGDESMPKI